MKKDRYDTTGLAEDTYEPGSRGRVLKNPWRVFSGLYLKRLLGRFMRAEGIGLLLFGFKRSIGGLYHSLDSA
jgi:hypothetical protein